MLFLGVLIVVAWLSPPMAEKLVKSLRVFLEQPHEFSLQANGLQGVFFETARQVGLATMLIFTVLAAVAILATMLQTGFFASFENIRPQIRAAVADQRAQEDFLGERLCRTWQKLCQDGAAGRLGVSDAAADCALAACL